MEVKRVSTSWADDDEEDDLGLPPPPSSLSPEEPQERKSYAQIAVEMASVPLSPPEVRTEICVQDLRGPFGIPALATRKKKTGPVRTVRAVSSYQATIEFAVVREAKTHVHVRRSAPAVPQEIKKCDKCNEERGYLKFTERHVEAQSKNAAEQLPIGVYCLRCVTTVSPRCSKPLCENKAIICLPDSNYPFGLFCRECINAHIVTLRS